MKQVIKLTLATALLFIVSACGSGDPETLDEMVDAIRDADGYTIVVTYDGNGYSMDYLSQKDGNNRYVVFDQYHNGDLESDFEMAMIYDNDDVYVYHRLFDNEDDDTVTAGDEQHDAYRGTIERMASMVSFELFDAGWFEVTDDGYVLRDDYRFEFGEAAVLMLLEGVDGVLQSATIELGEDVSLHMTLVIEIDGTDVDVTVDVFDLNDTTIDAPELE